MTTVRELIAQLEAVENKDLDVVIDSDGFGVLTDVEAIKGERYYGKQEECGWVRGSRECVVLIGYEQNNSVVKRKEPKEKGNKKRLYYLRACGLASSWLLVDKDRGSHEGQRRRARRPRPQASKKEAKKEKSFIYFY